MTPTFRKLGLAGVLWGGVGLGGCGTMGMMGGETWTMNTAESVPAAQGKVKVANQKDGNTKVKVEVDHLAPPALASEQLASTYVVWIKSPQGLPQNAGVLKVGSNRKGSLETKTPFKEFTVLVTLETSPAATIPTGPAVMDTRITMPT
jgi:hypothetical protein